MTTRETLFQAKREENMITLGSRGSDININLANTSARGSAIVFGDLDDTSGLGKGLAINLGHMDRTLVRGLPSLWQVAHHRPQQHQLHPRQHLDKRITIDLSKIDRTLANTSRRGSPSTSMTSVAPSPTLQEGALSINLSDID